MNRKECLEKAIEHITRNRNVSYGEPENSFALIAKFWPDWLQKKLKPGEVIEDYEVGVLPTTLFFILQSYATNISEF